MYDRDSRSTLQTAGQDSAMKNALLFAVLLTAYPVSAATPETILRDYFAAISAGDVNQFGDHIVPLQMDQVKGLMIEIIESESPRAVAMEKQLLGATMTLDEANQAAPRFFLGRIFSSIASGVGAASFSVESYKVLGSVSEDDDALHIVARVKVSQQGKTADDIAVFSFERVDGIWFMELPTIVRNYLGMIETGLRR